MDPKASAIGARREAGDALERAPDKGRIFVADLPADLVDRGLGPFQPALGVFDAQTHHVGNRDEAGRVREAPSAGNGGSLLPANATMDSADRFYATLFAATAWLFSAVSEASNARASGWTSWLAPCRAKPVKWFFEFS